jgi:hypothetical protein
MAAILAKRLETVLDGGRLSWAALREDEATMRLPLTPGEAVELSDVLHAIRETTSDPQRGVRTRGI